MIFETFFLCRTATLPYAWKTMSQKLGPFAFGVTFLYQTFIGSVFNQYTYFNMSIYQICLQIMARHLILLRFLLGIFIHYYWLFMSELLNLHQNFTDCISNQCWYVKMLDVTASYGMPVNFSRFFLWILPKIDEYSGLKCFILTKHSQIVCLINTHILIWLCQM